jgi:hypothetical protein
VLNSSPDSRTDMVTIASAWSESAARKPPKSAPRSWKKRVSDCQCAVTRPGAHESG